MLSFTEKEKIFIQENINANTDRILFNSSKYPDIRVDLVVDNIICRKVYANKLPEWVFNDNIVFPSRLSGEQCSSELTARYKQRLVKGRSIVDITGGLGVDLYYMSKGLDSAIYIEQNKYYSNAAINNFKELGLDNVVVVNENSLKILSNIQADTIYVDPARRDNHNNKVFSIKSCTPDISLIINRLVCKSSRVIVKLSPMIDIKDTLRLLNNVSEIHIVSVKNECKELIVIVDNKQFESTKIVTVDIYGDGKEVIFELFMNENIGEVYVADGIKKYIYEPNTSVMKLGCFKSLSNKLAIARLDKNTHIYTSDNIVEFPGRCFEVLEVRKFTSREIKSISKDFPKANVAVRNLPMMTVNDFRLRSKIADGGDTYIFLCTSHSHGRVILICKKIPISC